jgi:hypothetical protein
MAAELTWRKAIEKVLSEAPGPMRLSEITEKIIQDGLRSNLGATPQGTVWVAAHEAMKKEDCPFQKIGRGLFYLEGSRPLSNQNRANRSTHAWPGERMHASIRRAKVIA